MTDAQAYDFAAKHPEYVVLLSRESSQGRHWWHIRADGTRCCECEGCRTVDSATHRQIMSTVGRLTGQETHAVYVGAGRGGSSRRIAI